MTGIVDFRTELLDELGNPITALNPLPTTGGGGGSLLADVLLTDATGALFVARDNGTTVTYFNLNTNAVYTPSAPIQAAGLTDTQLRATPVPISGALTDTQLRAVPVQVQDESAYFLLNRMLVQLASPQGYDMSLQRYRQTAIVESGTLQTVGSITNIVGLGGTQAQILPNAANLAAWDACCRTKIT